MTKPQVASALTWGFSVELRGIEPLTYSMRTSRATNCAIAPGDRERSTVCHSSSLTGSLSKPAGSGACAR